MSNPLTPPDRERCQADVPGNGPFTMGGEVGDPRNGYRVRCREKPTCIATEVRAGDDGHHGSMSLCSDCRKVFEETAPPGYADFEEL